MVEAFTTTTFLNVNDDDKEKEAYVRLEEDDIVFSRNRLQIRFCQNCKTTTTTKIGVTVVCQFVL